MNSIFIHGGTITQQKVIDGDGNGTGAHTGDHEILESLMEMRKVSVM